MPKPLTQENLAVATCNNPDCRHGGDCQMFVHGRCHPGDPTWVSYSKQTGLLSVRCAICEDLIVQFLVATSDPARKNE